MSIDEAPLGAVRVGVLGPVAAWVDGDEVVAGPPRQRAVLAVLALAGRGVVSRDAIVYSLWQEQAPASADHAVQVYVSGIRRALGSNSVETVAPGYRLATSVRVDVDAQSELVNAAGDASDDGDLDRAVGLLRDAVAAWRGEPLAGLEDLPFALTEIPRLRDLRTTVGELHLAAELAVGNHHAVLGDVESLVTAAPDREEPQRLLLTALHRSGRREEALARYETWRRRLAEDLGLDPSPAMQALQLQLLEHDESLRAPARRSPLSRRVTLPVERTTLVGREAEIAQVVERVTSPGLTTLVGPGGVGKTRVALAVGRRVADEHDGSVVFVDLADETDAGMLPVATASALGMFAAGHGDGWEPYAAALAGRTGLIVLDNLEHLEGAGRLVGELLDLTPRCAVLATSRVRLRIIGEQVVPVPPLGVGGPGSSSAELFRRRAAAASPGTQLDDDDVAELTRRLDGMPLAIELAAGRVGMLPPGELVRLLDETGSAALADGPVDAPERHQSMERSLRWSFGLLDDSDRALLRRLGAFDGAFTIDSAREVAGAEPVGDVLAGLERLLDAHLLERTVGVGPPHFRTLGPVREFARADLETTGEAEQVRARHTAHHLTLAADLGPRLVGTQRRVALNAYDHARADLDRALHEAEPRDALAAAWAIWRAWQIRGRTAQGRVLVDELLHAVTEGGATASDPIVLRGRMVVAHLDYWQRDAGAAHAGYLAVADAARGHDADLTIEALANAALTGGYLRVDPDSVPALLAEIVPLGETSESPRRKCDAHMVAFLFHLLADRFEEALVEARECHRLAVESGDLQISARIEHATCFAALAVGDASAAFRAALEAVDYAASVDDLPMLVHSLDWSGAALAELGQRRTAVEVAAGVDALRRRIGAGLTLTDRGAATVRERVAGTFDETEIVEAWQRGSELDHAAVVAMVRQLAATGALP